MRMDIPDCTSTVTVNNITLKFSYYHDLFPFKSRDDMTHIIGDVTDYGLHGVVVRPDVEIK